MGLDMYLNAEIYVSSYKPEDEPLRSDLIARTGIIPAEHHGLTVSAPVIYWRKANAIHNWFVQNVQDGTDDCKDYYVSREDLEKLRDLCREVLAGLKTETGKVHVGTTHGPGGVVTENYEEGRVVTNPEFAEERLPATRGFFFGCTDYDEHYLQDLQHTADEIDRVLNCPALQGAGFEYHSSW